MFKLRKNSIKILLVIFFITLLPLIPTGMSQYQQSFYLAGASSIVPQISKTMDCKANLKLEKNDSNYNITLENLSEDTYAEWVIMFYKEKQMTLTNLEETTNGWSLKGTNLKPKEPVIIPINLEITPQEDEEKYLNHYLEKFVFLSSCKIKES